MYKWSRQFEQFENDEEKENRLLLHYTNRTAMDNAPLPEQHDNFQQQLSNFQRLLQHAINKFSTEKLNHMLRAVSKGISISDRDDYPKTISSLCELSNIVDDIKNHTDKKNGLHKGDNLSIAKYFEAYFDDMDYLRILKRNFDEKIYVCLYDYFYDPTDDLDGELNDSDDEMNASLMSFHQDKALRKVRSGSAVDRMSDKEKLSFAVSELFGVNQKWDQLFDEDCIDPDCFDDDSIHELLQYKDYGLYESVLRIIPDIFVKAHKSMELAKMWWTQANKVYSDLPKKSRSSDTDALFKKKEAEMTEGITALREEITQDEFDLQRLEEELKVLKRREEKFLTLSDTCEKLEMEANDLERRHNDLLLECSELNEQMKNVEKLSKDFQVIDYQLKTQEKELACVKNQLQSVSYKRMIMQSDLDWSMQLRPDMILFTADVADKINSLEGGVGLKIVKKRRVEKKLVLLRTNCDRMRQVMRRFIKSVDAHEYNSRRQTVMNNMQNKFELRKKGDEDEQREIPQRMEVIVSDTEEDQEMGGGPLALRRVGKYELDDEVFDSGVEETQPNFDSPVKEIETPVQPEISESRTPSSRESLPREKKRAHISPVATDHRSVTSSPEARTNRAPALKPIDQLQDRPEDVVSPSKKDKRRLRSEKALLVDDNFQELPPVIHKRRESYNSRERSPPKSLHRPSFSGESKADSIQSPLKRDRAALKSTSTDRKSSQLHSNYSLRSRLSSNTSPNRTASMNQPHSSATVTNISSSRLSNTSKLSNTSQFTRKSGSGQLAHRATGAKEYYMRFKHHRTNDSILNRKPFPKSASPKKSFVDSV
ncbi:hypothetical protein CAPTEDRAFT_197703 [Capitella teleta]|uniref:Uncharacterized protein n=1 Tax=Capitella teleta TaxID=283909 RepID=R7VL93_CAPTE|nr:hypothetical protein CAPTEDRAFT_197703 [Capitella teleta]|eukprot:ELU18061.1 hypothetical protein CAPTEDRAFT_197703 [Capitella teleta]